MKLYAVNVADSVIEIADPFPAEGGYVLRLAPFVDQTVDIPYDVFLRIRPQLMAYSAATPSTPLKIYWSVGQPGNVPPMYGTPDLDIRGDFQPHYAGRVAGFHPGAVSIAAPTTAITVKGYHLFGGCVAAQGTVGSGAGAVKYSAAYPGEAYNAIEVSHVVTGPNSSLLAGFAPVTFQPQVRLATNGSGVVTSTAADVVAAVNSSIVAQIVWASVAQGGTAKTGLVPLTGGLGPQIVMGYGGNTTGIDSFTVNGSGVVTAFTFTVTQDVFAANGLVAGDQLCIRLLFDTVEAVSWLLPIVA